ncbi:MAG: hypothetical protein ACE5GV_00370 [Candidatus Scalindua sp.]
MSYVREVHIEKGKRRSLEEKKKASELVEKARKEDSKIVKGVFKNHESPGGDAIFSIRLYKGDPIRTYNLVDGETYDLPLGVAKHINNQCRYKKHKWLVDKNGNKMMGADNPIERYSFTSTDYR